MDTTTDTKKYPETYLHVRDCKSGEEWIMPIRGNSTLDVTRLVRRWIKREFGGELYLDGKLMSRLEGDYYAQIKLDGEPPESVRCWNSGGFHLTSESCALLR